MHFTNMNNKTEREREREKERERDSLKDQWYFRRVQANRAT